MTKAQVNLIIAALEKDDICGEIHIVYDYKLEKTGEIISEGILFSNPQLVIASILENSAYFVDLYGNSAFEKGSVSVRYDKDCVVLF